MTKGDPRTEDLVDDARELRTLASRLARRMEIHPWFPRELLEKARALSDGVSETEWQIRQRGKAPAKGG